MIFTRLGLTGGIGSGKSTVAAMLAKLGASVIDADAISRRMTAAGGAAIEPIRAAFGSSAILPSGAMDRDFMRRLVFSDPEQRQRLEAIVHPLVIAEAQQQAEDAGQSQSKAQSPSGTKVIVFDLPLLVEGGSQSPWRSLIDAVLVVDCSPETQIKRVMQRSQLAPEQVKAIINAQASRSERLAVADLVINNDAEVTLQELEKRTAEIFEAVQIRIPPLFT